MSNQGWTQNESFDNWDDVSTEAPKALENNIYIGTIVKAEAQATKQKGKPSVKLEVSTTSVFQGDELPTARKLSDIVTVTKEAAFKVKQLAQSAQVEPPRANGFDVLTDWATSLVGCVVIFKTKQENYQKDGETRTAARIDRYLTADQAEKARNGGGTSAEAKPAADATPAETAPSNRRRRSA